MDYTPVDSPSDSLIEDSDDNVDHDASTEEFSIPSIEEMETDGARRDDDLTIYDQSTDEEVSDIENSGRRVLSERTENEFSHSLQVPFVDINTDSSNDSVQFLNNNVTADDSISVIDNSITDTSIDNPVHIIDDRDTAVISTSAANETTTSGAEERDGSQRTRNTRSPVPGPSHANVGVRIPEAASEVEIIAVDQNPIHVITPIAVELSTDESSRESVQIDVPTHVIDDNSLPDIEVTGTSAAPIFALPLTPKKPKATATATAVQSPDKDEDSECCPICFESWTNSGEHRVASLKCGHLFGKSCVEKWLKGTGGKCPQCNAKASTKDIRVIYAPKTLKMVDTSERDRAMKELERERSARKKAELEAASTKLRYQMALEECDKLKVEYEKQKQQLQTFESNKPSGSQGDSLGSIFPQSQSGARYVDFKTIKISEAGGCRVMAYCPSLATLAVSQPSSSTLFPGYGIKKINTLIDFKSTQYTTLHNKMIRDVSFNSNYADGLLLSCSVDKTVKITSLISNTVVQSYMCSMPLWSCVWDANNNYQFYAGQLNGTVLMYDIRKTSDVLQELNKEGTRSPVVSLQYVGNAAESRFKSAGLLVGQLDRCTFYEAQEDNTFNIQPLPIESNLTCLSLEESSRNIMASFRPCAKSPIVKHQMFALYTAAIDGAANANHICSCRNLKTFHGGSTAKLLTKTKLIQSPEKNGNLFAVAGDEASQSTHIWNATSGTIKQKLSANAAVLDVCPIVINDESYLATLTDKSVKIYKWTKT